jgi:hypothetical protein
MTVAQRFISPVLAVALCLPVATSRAAEDERLERPLSPNTPTAPVEEITPTWFDAVVGEEIGLFNPVHVPANEEASLLHSLGYLQGYEKGAGRSGIIVHDAERSQAGVNLYVSGHAPEARLMNMDGETLHVWRSSFRELCPTETDAERSGQRWFRRARLLPNGKLLAIFDYAALVLLDRDSRVLWSRCGRYHHDLDVDSEGRIYVLMSDFQVVPIRSPRQRLIADFVEILSAGGEPEKRLSIPKAIVRASRHDLFDRVHRPDAFHTNSLSLLPAPTGLADGPLRAGDLLLSMRNIDVIATLDPVDEKLTWALAGSFRAQHEARLLASGKVLLFDNLGRGGRSRVVELDPETGEVTWSYPGEGGDLYSSVCGSSQRLANGNTLITESTAGRALEVTPDRRVVWEFRSPHRVSRGGEVLVALLGDLVRIDHVRVRDWLESSGVGAAPSGSDGTPSESASMPTGSAVRPTRSTVEAAGSDASAPELDSAPSGLAPAADAAGPSHLGCSDAASDLAGRAVQDEAVGLPLECPICEPSADFGQIGPMI